MRASGLTVTRRTVIVGAGILTVGCLGDDDGDATGDRNEDSGGQSSNTDNPATGEVDETGDLRLTSPAFEDEGRIPDRYGREAEDVNPPLAIGNVPDGAESLALVVDDPDAVEPAGKVWDHWVVWNLPPGTATIPEDWTPEEATEGTNDYGDVGYGGPNPPDTEHRYRFKLFALETTLELPTETDVEALGSAMNGHVLDGAQLDGTYPA